MPDCSRHGSSLASTPRATRPRPRYEIPNPDCKGGIVRILALCILLLSG